MRDTEGAEDTGRDQRGGAENAEGFDRRTRDGRRQSGTAEGSRRASPLTDMV
jgi:hypothetical protein